MIPFPACFLIFCSWHHRSLRLSCSMLSHEIKNPLNVINHFVNGIVEHQVGRSDDVPAEDSAPAKDDSVATETVTVDKTAAPGQCEALAQDSARAKVVALSDLLPDAVRCVLSISSHVSLLLYRTPTAISRNALTHPSCVLVAVLLCLFFPGRNGAGQSQSSWILWKIAGAWLSWSPARTSSRMTQ